MRKQIERNKRNTNIQDPISINIMKQKESLTIQVIDSILEDKVNNDINNNDNVNDNVNDNDNDINDNVKVNNVTLEDVTINYTLNSDRDKKVRQIMRRINKYNYCVIYTNNFDAEVCMAIVANQISKIDT